MLTLQFLDGDGETILHPLGSGATEVILGSAPGLDVRLNPADQVAARHAKIQAIQGRRPGFKIVDLGSDSGTLLNGERVLQSRLSVGDRIELGRAVIVVGTKVSRPATAVDVLDRAPRRSVAVSGRSPRGSRPEKGRQPLWIGGAVLVSVVVCVLLFTRGSQGHPRFYPEIARQAELGEFDASRRLVQRLFDEWAGSDPARVAHAKEVQESVESFEKAVGVERHRVLRNAVIHNRGRQNKRLRKMMQDGGDSEAGRVARLLLTQLDGIREEADALPQAQRDLYAEEANAETAALLAAAGETPGSPSTVGGPAQSVSVDTDPSDETVAGIERVLAQARQLHSEGDLQGALEVVQASLDSEALSPESRNQVTEMRALIRDNVQARVADRLAKARIAAEEGSVAGVERAIAILRANPEQIPAALSAGVITREIEALQNARLAVEAQDASRAKAATAEEFLELARVAEDEGRFQDGLDALAQIAAPDGRMAEHVRDVTVDLEAFAALQKHLIVQARATQGVLELADLDGGTLRAHAADGRRLTMVDGEAPLPWSDVLPARLMRHVEDVKDTPVDAALAVAILCFRAEQPGLAERVLVAHFGRSGVDRKRLSGVIRRERRDVFVDERGYRVVDGRFVSARELDARAAAARVAKAVEAVVKRSPKTRDAALQKILAEGADVNDAVVLGLRAQLDTHLEEVLQHAYKVKVWDRLAAEREELDKCRAHALELIFDTDKYFAPYKPPAVSAEKAAEYREVQKEVDARVEAVQSMWDASSSAKKLPSSLAKAVDRLKWIQGALEGLGEDVRGALDQAAWIETLPTDGGGLHLRNFCKTARERVEFEQAIRVDAYNRSLTDVASRGEIEQVEVTNTYRRLLGRRVLAVSLELRTASRGHADEMADLGYFSHYSPTPGRESPFDRMRLAGYQRGSAENLALHASAKSAHDGWTHSSGHHRNLLGKNHTEIGVGQNGRYWVQNFGSGDTYRSRY